jgi:hypothetical protein
VDEVFESAHDHQVYMPNTPWPQVQFASSIEVMEAELGQQRGNRVAERRRAVGENGIDPHARVALALSGLTVWTVMEPPPHMRHSLGGRWETGFWLGTEQFRSRNVCGGARRWSVEGVGRACHSRYITGRCTSICPFRDVSMGGLPT